MNLEFLVLMTLGHPNRFLITGGLGLLPQVTKYFATKAVKILSTFDPDSATLLEYK